MRSCVEVGYLCSCVGTAGGEKFIRDGILLKYAVDPKFGDGTFLYGRSQPDVARAVVCDAAVLS